MTASPDGMPSDGTASMLIILARLEGKVDVVTAQHGAQLGEHARRLDDVELRLRAQESRPPTPPETDARLRAVESRPVVTPRAMWAGVGTLGALIIGAVGVLDKLIN
ncbi:hypothetical protein CA850_29730 [Micromonospora echinospora]|uniref:hypothetical protein n=1 Tax=Micromonospora echinospora TaxID=1877 RepID=UPI000B5B0CA6|nr:hypothetical protein [Micromonospora echinospora]OZV74760.1 hypothetical protein CA850_29730 [Micromonospora echinospora]